MICRMPNTSVSIKLPAAERAQLERWECAQGTPQQVALRCRIVLAALAGHSNVGIAKELGVSRPTVQLWRRRVEEQGIGQVWEIAPGRGRKPQFDQKQRAQIIGREAGLARLRGLVDPVPLSSQVLLVLGEAGMGKSALLADTAERARAAGMRVLPVTGAL